MLTLSDIKTLESLFIVEMHAAERIFRLADKIVAPYTHRVLSQDEQYHIGQLLKVCKTLHHYMARLPAAGIEMNPGTEDKGRKEMEMFDALQAASNQLAYVHALLSNVPESDMLKAISTLKVLAKDHSVSPAILEELKTN